MTGSRVGTVTVVGALPPPMMGAAQITALLSEELGRRARAVNLDTAPGGLARGPAYHLRRACRVAGAVLRLAAGGFGARAGAVYLSAAGGAGAAYDVVIAAFCRLLRRPLHIHHHSFAYVDRFERRTDLLARVAGPGCMHICLCPRMAEGLARRYPAVRLTRVVSNAAFLPPVGGSAPRPPRAAGALRIGHLSNLCRDKGLDLVIDTFAAAGDAAGGLVLAGAPVDDDAAAMLERARRQLGPRLAVLGPVAGDGKARFFADIDVFLFPTRYVNEAEPLVVIEALAAGVPVIAFGRGCIPHMIPEDAGLVVAPGSDFTAAALAPLARWAGDSRALAAASARATAAAEAAHAAARPALAALLGSLAGDGP